MGPDLQRRLQGGPRGAAAARLDDADEAPVVTVVVRDVAAGAQQPAHRPAQCRRQARGHQVEDRRAAGRHQHLVGVEEAEVVAFACERFDTRSISAVA
jgi:hypothetical protein